MNYRNLGKTGLKVSEIGLGCGGFNPENVNELIDIAEENGVNYFDLYMPDPDVRTSLGKALKNRRDKFIIQGHIGSVWDDGQYKRTRDLNKVVAGFEDLLERLGTDYIDIGMIHYVDQLKDWEDIINGPYLDYVKKLKKDGLIRQIGLGSHNPNIAQLAVDSEIIDVLMFSINPFYDLQPATEDINVLFDEKNYQVELKNMDPDRQQLYESCQRNGIGISVMKAFGGGRLLDPERSHVKKAITVDQALHYCLTRPAVATVLVGAHNRDEFLKSLAYENASDEDKDFAEAINDVSNVSWEGQCIYCTHCAPCPVKIDVASVNKYYDLARGKEIPITVAEHYESLEHHASECIGCHSCESRCPFNVDIVENMNKAKKLFGY